MTPFAGLGHIRLGNNYDKASKLLGLRSDLVIIPGLIASRTHRHGSSGLGQWATEVVQAKWWLQQLIAPMYWRGVRGLDKSNLKEMVRAQAMKARPTVMVCLHPDLSYLVTNYRSQLPENLRQQVLVVTSLTDHQAIYPQMVWANIHSDLVIAPDDQSATAMGDLLKWWSRRINGGNGKVPPVAVVPYPVDPRLVKTIADIERLPVGQRIIGPRILFPMGGSAPGQPFIQEMIRCLSDRGLFHQSVIVKEGKHTHKFIEQLMGMERVGLITHDDYLMLVDSLVEQYNQGYNLVVTKPSELTSLVRLPDSVLLLTQPVGMQEYDNLAFLRRSGVVADKVSVDSIMDHHINGQSLDQDLYDRARNWRAIELPADPHKAADLIDHFYRLGVLEAMVDQRAYRCDHPSLRSDGAFELPRVLDQWLGERRLNL